MSFLRSPLARIAAGIFLLALLCLSVLFIRNIVTAAWQSDQQETALYLRSPHCFPHQDPSEVDASLPPCRDVLQTIIAKPQNTVIDHRRSGDYPRQHLLLTLQDAAGQSQTVGDIHTDMWNSLRVGDQVSVTLWRNQVQEVNANGYNSTIIDRRSWNRAEAHLWPWIVVGLLSSCFLSLLWRFGPRQTTSSLLLP